MFSGIVETYSSVVKVSQAPSVLKIAVEKPKIFDDLSIGDSIAVNGVCLTLEEFNETQLFFTIGIETLKVTSWSEKSLQNKKLNLERSLKLNDRIHGHLVTGHVDAIGTVKTAIKDGECLNLEITFPKKLQKLIWKKGSIAVDGVSLTINSVENNSLGLCLIPETLKSTNLKFLKQNNTVNLEVDNWARGMINYFEQSDKGASC